MGPLYLSASRPRKHQSPVGSTGQEVVDSDDLLEVALDALPYLELLAAVAHRHAAALVSPLLHGEAVAIGMVLAFELSARNGKGRPEDVTRVRRHLEGVGLPVRIPSGHDWDPPRLLAHMGQDKKVHQGELTFVLPTKIGHCGLHSDITEADVIGVLEAQRAA